VLNLAKNLHRGAKVTLLVLAMGLSLAILHADELQTLVTTTGHRFEKARVTEVTPTTITIRHSAGLSRVPLSEFPADVQKKFGYDEAKAKACLAEVARQQQAQQAAAAWKKKQDRAEARARYAETQERLDRARASMNAVYDRTTGRWYSSAEEAAKAREDALRSR
jgi:hypothetical protein